MFHACGIYVPCLRPLSTTHGYDKGRIAFWGARKRLGALAVLCGFERRACKHRGCEAGLKHWGWVCAFGSCFSVVLLVVRSSGFVLLVVLFVVRSLGSCFWSFFRGSFFGFVLLVVLFVVRGLGSCFWSFFSWFVVWVHASGRSFRGSCFGFVLLVVLFVVRASVRSFGRSFRGSCFCSCFWSFFSWFFSWFVLLFVLLVVLFVVRSFGGSYVFFVRCFKSLRGVCGKVRGFLMQR